MLILQTWQIAYTFGLGVDSNRQCGYHAACSITLSERNRLPSGAGLYQVRQEENLGCSCSEYDSYGGMASACCS